MVTRNTLLTSALFASFSFALLGASVAGAQTTWYVDGGAAGPGDGSLGSPYSSVQYAVDQPATVAGDTLLLATGTYTEPVDLQGKALTLRGSGLVTLDAPQEADLVIAGLGSAVARVEGLRFAGGGDGDLVDGISVQGSGLLVVNCTFMCGSTWGPQVGGIHAEDSNVVVTGSSFNGCKGTEAGAMWLVRGSLELRNSTVERGDADNFQGTPFPVAGVRCLDATVTFDSSTFARNDSPDAAVGGAGLQNCQSTIVNCDFIRNDCSDYARTGSLHVEQGTLLMEDSTLFFGESYGQSGNLHLQDVLATIRRTNFDFGFVRGQGPSVLGGNMYQQGGTSTFEDCQFSNGDTSTCGGAAFVSGATSTLTRCSFTGNRSFYGPAPVRGSALVAAAGTNVTVRESIFRANLISCDSTTNPAATVAGPVVIERCTLIDNLNGASGNDVYGGTVTHSILWGLAGPDPGCPPGSSVGGPATVTWSDVQGGTPGIGNFDADPNLDSAGHLQAGSPCIDAGDPTLQADTDGSPRDIGAHAWSWPSVSIPECSAMANSTGAIGRTEAYGAPAAVGGTLYLRAADLPAQSAMMFLVSTAPGSIQLGNGGIGTLCLASPIGRFQIQATTTNAMGTASISVDSSAMPVPGGVATAGTAYWFQGWFRDVGPMGTPTSRVTTGISVQFQ